MSEPSKYPWNDENQELWLPKTLKNGFKLSILGDNQVKYNFADNNTNVPDVEFKKIVEVNLSRLLHHIVPDVISKDSEEYRSYVMKALNVPEILVMAKEVIKNHQHVILSFFSLWYQKSTDGFYLCFRTSSLKKVTFLRLFATVRSRCYFYQFWLSIQKKGNPRSCRIRGSKERARLIFDLWNYQSLYACHEREVLTNSGVIKEPTWVNALLYLFEDYLKRFLFIGHCFRLWVVLFN